MNSNPNNNRNRMRQRPTRPRIDPQVRALRNDIMGYSFTPAADPASITEIPWNSYVAEFVETTNNKKTVTVGDLATEIQTKLGLDATADVNMRIQYATCYVTAAGSSTAGGFVYPELRAEFFEVNDAQGSSRVQRSDKGDLNTPARAGYSYPVTDRKAILTKSNDSAREVVIALSPNGVSNIMVRVKVLWRK